MKKVFILMLLVISACAPIRAVAPAQEAPKEVVKPVEQPVESIEVISYEYSAERFESLSEEMNCFIFEHTPHYIVKYCNSKIMVGVLDETHYMRSTSYQDFDLVDGDVVSFSLRDDGQLVGVSYNDEKVSMKFIGFTQLDE